MGGDFTPFNDHSLNHPWYKKSKLPFHTRICILSDDTESNINGTSTRIAASVHSPSPSTKNNFAIRSSGKFPLISSLADVKTKTAGEKFRVVGYVREFRPNILRCQNNLILLHAICTQCCTSIPLLRFGESKRSSIESDNPKTTIPSCLKCNEKLVLYFNITVVVSGMYQL